MQRIYMNKGFIHEERDPRGRIERQEVYSQGGTYRIKDLEIAKLLIDNGGKLVKEKNAEPKKEEPEKATKKQSSKKVKK